MKWYRLAAEQGYADAQSACDRLEGRLTEQAEEKATESEIEPTDVAPASRRQFKFSFFGNGGEVVMGTITKEQYEYWSAQEESTFFDYIYDVASNNEDPEFEKIPQNAKFNSEWYEYDDIAHTQGIDFFYGDGVLLLIAEVDQHGEPLGEPISITLDVKILKENNILRCGDHLSNSDLEDRHFFFFYSIQKGTWDVEEIVETDTARIIEKLQLIYSDIDGLKLIDRFEYDGKEYGYLDVQDTLTKSSSFYVRAGSKAGE